MHNITRIPSPLKYSMLFDGFQETAFGRYPSMKPRGLRARLRFHLAGFAAKLAIMAITAHVRRTCAYYPKHRDGTAAELRFLPVELALRNVY